MKNWFSLIKLYFVIVSLVWVIWLTVWYGTALYQYITSYVVTNEEYVAGNYRELQNCTQPIVKPNGEQNQKTPEELNTCKTEMTSNLLAKRNKENKETIIGWFTRWTLFLILFLIHFTMMLQYINKNE
jgi:hypothetical protein